MLNPYRMIITDDDRPPPTARWDDRVLGLLLLALGGLRVAIAIATDENWGAEPTIAAVMALLGVLVLIPALGRR